MAIMQSQMTGDRQTDKTIKRGTGAGEGKVRNERSREVRKK